jgi:hypothetical protein
VTYYEGHLRDLGPDAPWFHVHRVTNPRYWGWWIMVMPDPESGQPKTLSFHESEIAIREIA